MCDNPPAPHVFARRLDPFPSLVVALVLGIVEGLTEFLPISSTGHLIVAGSLLGYVGDEAKVFEIAIQSGAMLAIVWEYRARFARVLRGATREPAAQRFIVNIAIAFVPAAVLGLLFGSAIKASLFHPVPVALAFVVGALVILWVERRGRGPVAAPRVEEVDDMTASDALKVGIAQAFALVPGMSRSGATIIGGMLFGLSRKTATEFSFFLAIPTMFAATAHEFLKYRQLFSAHDIPMLAVGSVVSFISAFIAVRALLRFVASHNFMAFAWYRIIFGVIVLLTYYFGWIHWAAD